MRPICINSLSVLLGKRYLSMFKMAEETFSGPQSDTKCQKLLECVLTGNSKLYLGKVYTEEQLAKLNEE